MKGVAIYVEGGGDSADGKARLRRGLNRFLSPLRQRRSRKMRWSVILGGSRAETIKDFLDGVSNEPEFFNVLLVDSDASVEGTPLEHLRSQSALPESASADPDSLHLMVQTMETWLVADPDGLADVYGKAFKANALPSASDLERVDKNEVEKALRRATEDTRRGRYHKLNHIEDLLSALDSSKVRKSCKHCERLFAVLERRIGNG